MGHRAALLVAVALAAVFALAGCGDDGSGDEDSAAPASTDCDAVVGEELDPNSSIHLVPGDSDPPEYLTDPPTSGPHFSSPPLTGVQEEPLPPPLQVTVLEVGDILAQYNPDEVTGDDLTALEGLADGPVVVSPNPDLDDPVVLTAWLQKQTCRGVDPEAITAFADAHKDNAPG